MLRHKKTRNNNLGWASIFFSGHHNPHGNSTEFLFAQLIRAQQKISSAKCTFTCHAYRIGCIHTQYLMYEYVCMCHIYLGISAQLCLCGPRRDSLCMCVLRGGDQGRGPTGKSVQQGTMPQMQLGMRLAYSRDMFVCLSVCYCLKTREKDT